MSYVVIICHVLTYRSRAEATSISLTGAIAGFSISYWHVTAVSPNSQTICATRSTPSSLTTKLASRTSVTPAVHLKSICTVLLLAFTVLFAVHHYSIDHTGSIDWPFLHCAVRYMHPQLLVASYLDRGTPAHSQRGPGCPAFRSNHTCV